MIYQKLFDPASKTGESASMDRVIATGDRPGSAPYEYTPEIELALNVALATGRPLLVRGVPGSGKSSLAYDVAQRLGFRYYATVVTSRTQAEDLLWKYDALRRLNDATAKKLEGTPQDDTRYIEPGVLWWAFDRDSARRRGGPEDKEPALPAVEPAQIHPNAERAVVLIDEIDKADPDVPNNLLVPLGSFEFVVREGGVAITVRSPKPPLILITTNGERELPPAFLRRCILLELPDPDADRLVLIAAAHFGPQEAEMHRAIADQVIASTKSEPGRASSAPNAAEYLDLIRACAGLGVKPDPQESTWISILNAALAKPPPSLAARGNA